MGHPEVDNTTPLAFEALFVTDGAGRPVAVPIVKGTFVLGEEPQLASVQDPVRLMGLAYGEPGETSDRMEPQVAFLKPGTDVALVGHAHAPRPDVRDMEVDLRLGDLHASARVRGNRFWQRRLLRESPSKPEPFERIPLVWERAFGGWDRHSEDPEKHRGESRNPFGVGFRRRLTPFQEGAPLPNIEGIGEEASSFSARVRPQGFGFTGAGWTPRRDFAGTYDKAWTERRSPLLPVDFDPRFFQAAAPGLSSLAPLRGDERGVVRGATAAGEVIFQLPGMPPPTVAIELANAESSDVPMVLDTVVVDTDAMSLQLTWRGCLAVPRGAHDVDGFFVAATGLPGASADLPPQIPFDQPLKLEPAQ